MTATLTTVAERVADAFLAGDAEAFAACCSDDVLLDLVLPSWRFQVQGRDALREQLREEFPPGRRIVESHVTPTADGVLIETEGWAPIEGEQRMWRDLSHLRVEGDRVTEIVSYCSGIWDAATIARHAVEAPMVRAR